MVAGTKCVRSVTCSPITFNGVSHTEQHGYTTLGDFLNPFELRTNAESFAHAWP
jgi:hypothetical protein